MFRKFWKARKESIEPSSAGRLLAQEGARQRRERIRAVVDEMRREMGKPPVDWSAL